MNNIASYAKKQTCIRIILFVFICAGICGCAGKKNNKMLKLDAELKKEAIDKRTAVSELQYDDKKNIHPNFLKLAQTLTDKGFYDIALVQLQQAEKTDNKNPEIFFLRGVCFREKKKYKKAVDEFKKAVKLDPDYSDAYAGLGITSGLLEEPQKAVDYYNQAIELNPATPGYYNNLGISLISLGKIDEAVKCFKKSISLNPSFVRAVNNLGLAYGFLDKEDLALAAFKKTGDEACAYNNMGYMYEMRNNIKMAAKMYKQALKINPDHKQAGINLIQIEKLK